jgi:two-component system chemotaxis sensor kinase CheA
VLQDAAREGRFRDEAQVVALGCKSVACVPLLRQRRLSGVLYLENRLTEGAFTNERVEMLQLIAAQAAISLENAALYANLEERVAERTRALDAQNARMRLVLDNVEQGFMLAERDGAIEGQHSRSVEEWFGALTAGQPVWSYLHPEDASTAGTMRVAWGMLSEGMFPIELCLEQLPARFSRGGRQYETTFRPILDPGGELERVLVVVTDITSKLIAARAEAAKQELADLLDQALSDRAGFRELMSEGRRLVETIRGDGDAVRRAIHTLKGNAALWQLRSVASLCHEVENAQRPNGDTGVSAAHKQAIASAWEDGTSKVERLLVRDTDELGVRTADYEQLTAAVHDHRPHHELEALLGGWTKEPIARRFERFGNAAKLIAQQLGKSGLRVSIEAEDLRTTPIHFSALWAAFTHLLRNAIDHGIEAPDVRSAAGKPAQGRLTFRAFSLGEAVLIEVADDGRGIDWKALAKKAHAAGLPSETQADLRDALFADGISTREQASEISGRGIGLAAVKAAVIELGGSIDVRSERGAGTCFAFRFPVGRFQSVRGSLAPQKGERPSQPAPRS